MFGINYNGLRKRESYDDLVKYIETDPNKIRYPNRTATFIERSHYMKHLGGEDYIEMEEQQIRASKEKVKEDIVRDMAGRGDGSGSGTASLLRDASMRSEPRSPPGSMSEEPRPPPGPNKDRLIEKRQRKRENQRERKQESNREFSKAIDDFLEEQNRNITEKRVRNQDRVIEELSQVPAVPAAASIAEETQRERGRPRKRLPEPVGEPEVFHPEASSSSQPQGSTATAEYKRRQREEELLKLRAQELVSRNPKLENDPRLQNVEFVINSLAEERARSRSAKRKKREEERQLARDVKAINAMEANEAGRKRSVSKEIPKAKAKAKTMAKDIDVDAGGSKRSGEAASSSKKKAKKENAPAPLSVADVEVVKADAKPEQQSGVRKEHGTEMDTNKSKSYWLKKGIPYIRDQLSKHGVRLEPYLFSGKKQEFDVVKNKNKTVKVKKITKAELVELILKELS